MRTRRGIGAFRRKAAKATLPTYRFQYDFEYDLDAVSFCELRLRLWDAIPKLLSALEEQHFVCSDNCRQHLTVVLFDKLTDFGDAHWTDLCVDAHRHLEQAGKLTHLDVGKAQYALRGPRAIHVDPVADHEWTYTVEGFSPRFVGRGESIDASRKDFGVMVHKAFQMLVGLRPFRMTPEQHSDWRILEDAIDVDAYRASVPLTIIEVGVVTAAGSDGCTVKWIDGDREEHVRFEEAPPEFAALSSGQWIEALVERQAIDYSLNAIRFVRNTEALEVMDAEECDRWIRTLPSDDSLPRSEIEWTTL
ncbi:MAG: hypothetical protein WD069_07965 [Planctomycetales bacterium]